MGDGVWVEWRWREADNARCRVGWLCRPAASDARQDRVGPGRAEQSRLVWSREWKSLERKTALDAGLRSAAMAGNETHEIGD